MEGLKAMSKLNILYEDNHVIVVLKEVNVPTQEDASKDKDLLSMVKDYIKEKYQKSGERLPRPCPPSRPSGFWYLSVCKNIQSSQ